MVVRSKNRNANLLLRFYVLLSYVLFIIVAGFYWINAPPLSFGLFLGMITGVIANKIIRNAPP